MITGDILLLQHSPYFHDLRPEDLALVQRRVYRRDLTAGELFLLEGQPAEALYLVCRGRVRIFRSTAEGREQVLFVAGAGATFNDVAAFDGSTALANAQALGRDASILVVPSSLLAHLMATNPRMAMNVVQMLTRRVRQVTAVLEDVSLRHTTQRVARILAEEGSSGTVVVNRQEIATRIGTVREVVSRALRHLEEAGAVRRLNGRALEVDMQMLHALVAAEQAEGMHQAAAPYSICATAASAGRAPHLRHSGRIQLPADTPGSSSAPVGRGPVS